MHRQGLAPCNPLAPRKVLCLLSHDALEFIQTKSALPFYLEFESTRIPEELPLYPMSIGVAGFEPTR